MHRSGARSRSTTCAPCLCSRSRRRSRSRTRGCTKRSAHTLPRCWISGSVGRWADGFQATRADRGGRPGHARDLAHQPDGRRHGDDARGGRPHRARADRGRPTRRRRARCPAAGDRRVAGARGAPHEGQRRAGRDVLGEGQHLRPAARARARCGRLPHEAVRHRSTRRGHDRGRGHASGPDVRAGRHRHRGHRPGLTGSGLEASAPYPWLAMQDRFLRALRRDPVDRTPVWFMRQAGRYLPEYRELRGERDILETIRRPEEAVEITLQPLRRMPLDAAIVFSDIVVPLAAIGLPIRVEQGRGPVLDEPVHSEADLRRLRPLEPEVDEPYALEAIRLLVKELDVPLIGFAGAPFTLASYLIEGGPSRDHARTKALWWGDPSTWNRLLDALTSIVVAHVRTQVTAGATAVQIFDSWVGALAPDVYRKAVVPHMRQLFGELADLDVPTIHFGVGTG